MPTGITRSVVQIRNELRHPRMQAMNFLNEAAERYGNAISLAAGRPPDLFASAEQTTNWIARFVRERAATTRQPEQAIWRLLGQYGASRGMIGDLVARFLAQDEGLEAGPRDLVITNGMQEAVLLLLLCVCDSATDVVLSDDPTYVGLEGAAVLAGVAVEALTGFGTTCERAKHAAALVRAAGRRARALYLIPDFSNPLGRTLTLAERVALLDFAWREEMLLIEDTAYRSFRYEGEMLPSLKSMDEHGVVVQVGSFSKCFMPGPRVGYIYADQDATSRPSEAGSSLAEVLATAKSYVSVLTSPVAQAMVGGFLLEHEFSLEHWNLPRIALCRMNRDALIVALEENVTNAPALKGQLHWARPSGGFFLPLTLPFTFGTTEMMTCAADYGVIVCPMNYFSADPQYSRLIRIAFSNVDAASLREGVARLCRFVNDRIAVGPH